LPVGGSGLYIKGSNELGASSTGANLSAPQRTQSMAVSRSKNLLGEFEAEIEAENRDFEEHKAATMIGHDQDDLEGHATADLLVAADNDIGQDDDAGLIGASEQFDEQLAADDSALPEDKETEGQQQESNLFD